MSYQLVAATQQNTARPASTLIYVLNDDSLFNIVSLCRALIFDESDLEAIDIENMPEGSWSRERWWYSVVHVFRRWRYLVLEFPSHLRLSLFYTRQTPVTDMPANSPLLPLIIDFSSDTTTDDSRWTGDNKFLPYVRDSCRAARTSVNDSHSLRYSRRSASVKLSWPYSNPP